MADVELVKKMLREVLTANKSGPGVSLSRLQSEYKDLTGEQIPHKQMGHGNLDALLHSMPSVVRMERNRSGEVRRGSVYIYIYITERCMDEQTHTYKDTESGVPQGTNTL